MSQEHSNFSKNFLNLSKIVCEEIDERAIDAMADGIAQTRQRDGRLFILGVGGSAANASHAVNDFRKLCNVETYAPTDNVSELSARVNDEGWETVFSSWLDGSRLNSKDAILVFSVGGGNAEANVSMNLVEALKMAQERSVDVFGIVGRDGGFTAEVGDVCVIIPTVNANNITPHSEAFQAVVWHLLVSHPVLKSNETKWESAIK